MKLNGISQIKIQTIQNIQQKTGWAKPLLIKNEGGKEIVTWFNRLSDNDKKLVVGQDLNMEDHTWNDTFAAIRYGENMVVKHIPGQFEADGITPKFELGSIILMEITFK